MSERASVGTVTIVKLLLDEFYTYLSFTSVDVGI